MKFLKATIAFFADDVLTAGMVIVWIALAALATRLTHAAHYEAAVFFAGMLFILIYGVWRRSRAV